MDKELLKDAYDFFSEEERKKYRFSLFLVDIQCFFIKLRHKGDK